MKLKELKFELNNQEILEVNKNGKEFIEKKYGINFDNIKNVKLIK